MHPKEELAAGLTELARAANRSLDPINHTLSSIDRTLTPIQKILTAAANMSVIALAAGGLFAVGLICHRCFKGSRKRA
jgi:hypothetical protein